MRAGLLYDPFQQRLLFPWCYRGLFLGVTGRAVYPTKKYKTLPYFGTNKKQCFYLPQGFIDIGTLVLCEGEIDALKIYSAGHRNVAALSFGSFTDAQTSLVLKSAASKVCCFFDDDQTGARLCKLVVFKLCGARRISAVDYSSFRNRYRDKLDPGVMSRRDIRWALKKCVIADTDWQSF